MIIAWTETPLLAIFKKDLLYPQVFLLLQLLSFGLAVRVSKQSNYGGILYATVFSSTPRITYIFFLSP